jgi:preprotein translocase subunit SecG
MTVVVGILLVISALILIVTVLLQDSKQSGLGAVSGAAETFFGKTKAARCDKVLSIITTVVAVVFTVLVLAMYLMF